MYLFFLKEAVTYKGFNFGNIKKKFRFFQKEVFTCKQNIFESKWMTKQSIHFL